MEFELSDQTGFGNVKLGMSRSILRERLGRYREFRRTEDAPPSDQFLDAGLMATYYENGTVAFLELSEPASLTVAGVNLIGLPLSDAKQLLESTFALYSEPEDEGIRFDSWRLALYAPDDFVSGVLLGE